jgi:hypothetical protein
MTKSFAVFEDLIDHIEEIELVDRVKYVRQTSTKDFCNDGMLKYM